MKELLRYTDLHVLPGMHPVWVRRGGNWLSCGVGAAKDQLHKRAARCKLDSSLKGLQRHRNLNNLPTQLLIES